MVFVIADQVFFLHQDIQLLDEQWDILDLQFFRQLVGGNFLGFISGIKVEDFFSEGMGYGGS